MTTESHGYDPKFFQQEKDKENISALKSAIQGLPEVRRKLFEQHERYTNKITELKTQISKEKDLQKIEQLRNELESYEASLAHIEPAYRTQYVALQATLINNLITIQSAQAATDKTFKDANAYVDEPRATTTAINRSHKRV